MKKFKVLVLVDVQNDFITGALRNEDAIKAVPNIVKKVKEFDGDLIARTWDTHFNETYMTSREGQKLPVPHCIEGTEGWDIESSVVEAVSENKAEKCFVYKRTFGAVALADDIEQVLSVRKDYNYREDELDIEVCGFCTDICVVSNALLLKANLYENADIKVIKNCCAGVTPETNEAALNTMKMCQIDII